MFIPNAAARALALVVKDREEEIHEALTFFASELRERGVEGAREIRELAESIRTLVNMAELPLYDLEAEALLDPTTKEDGDS